MYSTVLSSLSCGLVIPLGVTLSDDELIDCDRGSLALP